LSRSPEDIIGRDALFALECAGFKVIAADQKLPAVMALDIGGDDFSAFWKVWPNKVGKPAAQKAFVAARRKGHTVDAIMLGLERYIATKPPDRPWLNPATFLNQERFNDQPAQVAAKPQTARAQRSDELRDYEETLRREIENAGFVRDQSPALGNEQAMGGGTALPGEYRRIR
jgi:hypothetical protein